MTKTHTPREVFEKQKLLKRAIQNFNIEYENGIYDYDYALLQHRLENLTQMVKEVNIDLKAQ